MLRLLLLIIFFSNIHTTKINTKPSHKKYDFNVPLFWKIAKKNEISSVQPKRFIFNDYPIAIYKDVVDNSVKAISDICIHRGASLSQGKVIKNCVQCPYHGWEYKDDIPLVS